MELIKIPEVLSSFVNPVALSYQVPSTYLLLITFLKKKTGSVRLFFEGGGDEYTNIYKNSGVEGRRQYCVG